MAITTSYTRGVKYIKVSRFDANGIDQSTQLQNINNIRMLFSDYVNPVDYPAVSITEYPDYYLYAIIPTDVTSSADNEILNYKVSASGASISDITPSGYVGPKIYQLNNFSVSYPGSNPLGYFNTGTGTWALGNTPNITLNVTASITFTTVGTSSAFYSFALSPTNGPDYPYYFPVSSLAAYLSVPGAGTYTITLSGSITPLENTSYNLTLSPNNVGSTVSIFGIGGGYMVVTQSTTPYASPGTTLTVLEPYIDEEFRGSDCDILQNNVILNSPNAFYMVVDYTNGSIIATNQQSILSGSATRAQIQNWNYTYASQINGRYIGKEQNAIAYNVYTSASQFVTESAYGFTGSWPGDTTSPLVNGGVVVEYLDSCIYTTNWGGGGYPENANGGGLQTNDILLVGSTKDDVAVFPEDNISYFDTLTKNIPFGTEFLIKQYNQTAASTIKATSLYPGVSLNDAQWWIPSNFSGNGNGSTLDRVGRFYTIGSGSINQPLIQLYATASNGSGVYINKGTRINGVQQTQSRLDNGSQDINLVMINISNSISSGIPWFASLYNGSGSFTASGSIPGLPPSTTGLPDIYQIGYPFEIYQIQYNPSFTSASVNGVWNILIKNAPSTLFNGLSNPSWIGSEYVNSSSYNLGLILTSGNPSTNFITSYIPTPSDSWDRFSNIGPGYITTQYPKSIITQNTNYITKTYGNNPNP
jgi:hypothetical protein